MSEDHQCKHHKESSEDSAHVPEQDMGDNVFYTCPMHPDVVRETPGMCPECGMSLVKRSGTPGTEKGKHAGHSTNAFLRTFWIALILTVPLVIYSELTELFFGWEAPRFTGYEYLMLLLGSLVYFYAGWVFLTGAVTELKGRLPGMMTLIALAITAAYLWSVYATFTDDMTLFWELGTLVTIMLLGHWIEMRAVKGARGALKELAELLPETAYVIRNGETHTVSVTELKKGDTVLVKPGSKIPADGIVKKGSSEVDESVVTGESRPVSKTEGDEVVAGAMNGDGNVTIQVTKVGEDTFLAGVMRLVSEAEASKSRLQLLSDKAALVLTAIAVGVGLLTVGIWLAVGEDVAFAVARLVAVLVIACPHALGLAVPLVASISTNMAASNGFIIKQRLALEAARSVDVVLFDKTGTLTRGEFGVEKVLPAGQNSSEDVLALGASINQGSEHSLAAAIVEAAREKEVSISEIEDFERLPGKGAKAVVAGTEVLIGSDELLSDAGVSIPEQIKKDVANEEREGKTVVHIISGNEYRGAISLADVIRDESYEAVEMLHAQGIRVAMVTGDSEEVAAWVSEKLGIDEHFSRVLPGEKQERVKELQGRGHKVAMVGDGVNDAPALVQADVGIAIGAGTNVAVESAGIILVKNDPRDIGKIIRLSRLTYRKMVQNLFWATGYNVVALPLAAGALIAWGIVIEPAVGAIFMSVSTVIVAFNAVLMKRQRLGSHDEGKGNIITG